MDKAFENILERIDSYIEDAKSEGDFSYIKPFEIAKIAVQEVAEEYNGGWIPCSERLPEKDGNYLITFKGRVYEAYYQDGFWLDPIEFYRVYRSVTAWQPLPAPYNPKGE